jgi:16S rRNA (guanine966-N2)-methyltransferase
MRVIAGSAGGIQLDVPKQGVRPTMDRVKGAIFSSLSEKIVGACVLDLFAGSGALGIEALSRGAASVLFVDQDRRSIEIIERNLRKTHTEGRTRQQEVFDFLRKSYSLGKFDIVFADPPYDRMQSGERFTDQLLHDPALPALVAPEGLFVLEKRPAETLPEMPLWNLVRQKTYGATEVLFLARSKSAICDPQSAIPS